MSEKPDLTSATYLMTVLKPGDYLLLNLLAEHGPMERRIVKRKMKKRISQNITLERYTLDTFIGMTVVKCKNYGLIQTKRFSLSGHYKAYLSPLGIEVRARHREV